VGLKGAHLDPPKLNAPRFKNRLKVMDKNFLKDFKRQFRDWLGSVSVEELSSNPKIAEHVRLIEKFLTLGGSK